MSYLVQILLPISEQRHMAQQLSAIKEELTERFGGVTMYINAAEGLWDDGDDVQQDRIAVVEVMAPAIHRPWWKAYKYQLQSTFDQDEVVIRTAFIDRI
ncbi:hypothetical protein JNB88_28930 [Rhizobium cauense]|uniref:hypothetical protein n=1 Tax=Rhizobium cauense TaxID=1166683 RepID=UPI001C6F01CA|nr:hypothetical protein [Rhizobium cauense]MBW9117650.1 hypothetical protein [Rhizobium cauense]